MKTTSHPPPALPQRLSLVAQTVQSLRESIQTGQWQKLLPGERKLCAHLQVGRRTMRAALDELQRAGWLDVAGRQRRTINTRRIRRTPSAPGMEIVILAPCSPVVMSFDTFAALHLLRDRLSKAGYATHLHVSSASFSVRPARALEKLAGEHPSALWIVWGSKEPLQRWFMRQRKPCIIAGSCDSQFGLPSIDTDFRAASRHAVGVFIRKGHQHIALVLPKDAYGGDIDSEAGFREGIATAERRTRHTILRHNHAKEHLCSVLDAALRSPVPPTAFLVSHTTHVITVMMHLMRRGKRIPQDVAVISRNDDRYLEPITPTIARYAVSHEEFARRFSLAVRQLAETGSLPPRAIRLMPEFIAGETV